MIAIKEVLRIHEILIEKFGGSQGVRDMELLESALHRPFGTFGSVDLYPSPIDKAAAIIESIVKNHPFVDGNKRTGYTMMRLVLLNADLDIISNEDDKYEFVIGISEGKLGYDEIKNWIKSNLNKSN